VCFAPPGTSLLSSSAFMLIIEHKVVYNMITSFLAALMMLFTAFYNVNLAYPPEVASTLEFIQRYLTIYIFFVYFWELYLPMIFSEWLFWLSRRCVSRDIGGGASLAGKQCTLLEFAYLLLTEVQWCLLSRRNMYTVETSVAQFVPRKMVARHIFRSKCFVWNTTKPTL